MVIEDPDSNDVTIISTSDYQPPHTDPLVAVLFVALIGVAVLSLYSPEGRG